MAGDDFEKMDVAREVRPDEKGEEDVSASSRTTGPDFEEEVVGRGETTEEVETPEESSNLLACLQVLGSFFLMFNSWCDISQ